MSTERLPKDLVLLQLALVLLGGGELTYDRLAGDFLLERRTAERYIKDLRAAGLPIESRRDGRKSVFVLDNKRSKTLSIEAVDVPPKAARSLSLLLVAAALLPSHLGVREAVDATVRAALRLRGMKASSQLRRLEDCVLVLENDAKDYEGTGGTFGVLLDATLAGQKVTVQYRSPRDPAPRAETFYSATIGLYRGGLYALAVPEGDDGRNPIWRAIERVTGEPTIHTEAEPLGSETRMRALDAAARRWGPARPRPEEDEQVITLHFTPGAAPYVLARPWHPKAEFEPWEDGGLRMAIRLSGQTIMFESWVRSWGPEVQVLRPREMAERIADDLARAAQQHRDGPERWRREVED